MAMFHDNRMCHGICECKASQFLVHITLIATKLTIEILF